LKPLFHSCNLKAVALLTRYVNSLFKMRCRIIGLLILATSAICFGQDASQPLVSSRNDDPIKADDPRAIQAHSEVQALIFKMTERWNAHDIAGYMEGVWKSKDFLMVIDGQETRGWAEAAAAYERGYSDTSLMGNLVCDRLETQLMTPELALVVDRWTLYLKGGRVLGTSTMVVRKFADGWKIISDHSTTLEP
jgi:ketosteroid isomerase-like protein